MSTTTLSSPMTPTTASRASWSGQLQLGPLAVPVKAYPALVAPTSGPLHQVHVACGRRISQRKVCPDHGELTADEIGKAFEFAPNDQLAVSQEELDSLSPIDDQTIHLEHLLPSEKFDCSFLSGRTLHLTPTHPAGRAYRATFQRTLNAPLLHLANAGRPPRILRNAQAFGRDAAASRNLRAGGIGNGRKVLFGLSRHP